MYDILEDFLPRLNKDPEFPAPHSDDFATIHEYADQFEAFIQFEKLADPPRIYGLRDQVRRFIKNLGPAYASAVPRVEILLDGWKDPDPPPPPLEMHSLPKTIENYASSPNQAIIRAANGNVYQHTTQNKQLSNNRYQQQGDKFDKDPPCDACHIPGHHATDCNAWAKSLILARYGRHANDAAKKQAIDNYMARIKNNRNRRSKMKATIRQLVDARQIDEILALIPLDSSSDEEATPTPPDHKPGAGDTDEE